MINKRLAELTKKNSAIREMFEEGNRLSQIYGRENVFDYSLGNPIVETPAAVKEAINTLLNEKNSTSIHGYMPNAGYKNVREAVANDLNKRFSMNYSFNNIIMTVGAAGALNCVLQTLLNPDDEVIVCAPFFVEYINYITNWGGKAVVANNNFNDFSLSTDNLSIAITSKTKAIIINNPNNPTGVVYSPENIQEVCCLLRKKEKEFGHPIYIVSDEPYRELVYDGLTVPYIPNYYDNSIVVYSWSKSLSLPGERIGYLAVSPNAVDSALICYASSISNRIIGFVNAPSLFQQVIEKTINVEPDIDFYNTNRTILFDSLTKIGFECIYPQGAFYLWVKTPCEEKLFVDKAKELCLLLVPGSAFYCKGYVRIAYCVSREQIEKSILAFQKLWKVVTSK